MAYINPKTGSTQFRALIKVEGVVSLAGESPVIVSQEEEFTLKILSDAISGEELSHKDLQEVPDNEIGKDGIWVNAQAAKLKGLSQEELIAMVLELQAKSGGTPVTEDEPAENAPEAEVAEVDPEVLDAQKEFAHEELEEESEELPVEEEAKPKRRKKPAKKEEVLDEEEVAF